MKHLKNLIAGGIAVLTLTTTTLTALAAPAYETPAQAAAGATGKTVEEVLEQRRAGKGYGMIAAESDALEEFQAAVLELHQQALAAMVEDGRLTQQEADERLAALQQRQANCDGSGMYSQGRGYGCGYGRGMGWGLRDGSCLNP
ncbi:MAG: hypothetical protein HFG20_07655 [Anaerotruncus sp.]|nr:hypothetical protein [Anaerotruncus sp.]